MFSVIKSLTRSFKQKSENECVIGWNCKIQKHRQDKRILQFGKYILVKLPNNERMAKRRGKIAK